MNKRTIIISYLLIALLTAPQAVLAQTGSGSNRDWAAVMTVHPGEKLAIKVKNGQTVVGKLSSVSESGLALAIGGKTAEINREDTQRVYRIAGASPKRPTLIGAAIRAAGGCAYRKSHPTFRRLHLQDLHPDTTHRLSNLDFAISLLFYGSLPSSPFPCRLLFCASP